MNPMRWLTALLVIAALAACSATAEATPEPSAGAVAATPTTTEPPSSGAAPATPTTAPASPSASASHRPADALLDAALTDVRTGETFTLGELATQEGPVLLEPMAIWCTKCLAQQREVVAAHERSEAFSSVSLDVDLSEAAADLARYADAEGFGWRFAVAGPDLYRLLQERFGVAATNPPSTPLIVVEPDGTVRPLEFGVGTRNAQQLLAELGLG